MEKLLPFMVAVVIEDGGLKGNHILKKCDKNYQKSIALLFKLVLKENVSKRNDFHWRVMEKFGWFNETNVAYRKCMQTISREMQCVTNFCE